MSEVPPTRAPTRAKRRVVVVDNRHVARAVGERIRQARMRAGLTQAEVAKGRYTSAYISALERGLAKPSMAALSFVAERLGVPVATLVPDETSVPGRLQADLLLASGEWQAAADEYEALLDSAKDRRLRAELLKGRAEALCRLGRGGDAMRAAAEAAEIFASIGARVDEAWARYWLASSQYLEDNPAEARGILQELLAAERSGLRVSPDFRFRLLTALGHVEAWDGQPRRALTYMEEARALMDGLALRQRAAFLSGLALQYRHAGDLERSVRAGMESLTLYRAAELDQDEAALRINMALTYLQLSSRRRAAEHLKRARQIADRTRAPRLESEVAEAEAQLAYSAGDKAAARDRVEATLRAVDAGGSYLAAVGALTTRARMARDAGDQQVAEGAYSEAAALLRDHGAQARLRDLLAEWGEARTRTGDLVGANRLYAEALGREARPR